MRFRRSGKPSWAHLEFAGNKEYYLATGCAKIAASPTAMLDVSGLSAEVTFYKGTLDKLGRRGAVRGGRASTRTPRTSSRRRASRRPTASRWRRSSRASSTSTCGRSPRPAASSPQDVRALVDRGPFHAPEAKEAGLVDELLYRDQVEDRIPAAGRVSPRRYVKAGRGFGFDGRPKVALVYAVGEIVPGESQSSPFGGGLAGSDTIIRGLRQASRGRRRPRDHPARGQPGRLRHGLRRDLARGGRSLGGRSPSWSSMGDYAASGGYYIAMGADAIVAEPGTITGSIGVFSGKFSLRGLYEKLGVSQETVRRGKNATLFSSWEPVDGRGAGEGPGPERGVLRDLRGEGGRGAEEDAEEIDAVAQGRVWTGEEALRARPRGRARRARRRACAVARERARIAKGQEVQIVVLPQRKGLLETLMERQDEDVLVARCSGPGAASFLRWATALGDRGPIARVPFDLAGPLSAARGAVSCRSAGAGASAQSLLQAVEALAVDAAEGLVRASGLAPWPAAPR